MSKDYIYIFSADTYHVFVYDKTYSACHYNYQGKNMKRQKILYILPVIRKFSLLLFS
jgi:hypothetical protein